MAAERNIRWAKKQESEYSRSTVGAGLGSPAQQRLTRLWRGIIRQLNGGAPGARILERVVDAERRAQVGHAHPDRGFAEVGGSPKLPAMSASLHLLHVFNAW